MISASSQLKTLLEQDTTLIINCGCTIEYNMNNFVSGITMSGAQISRVDASGNLYYPFQKLFPIDTVVKPFRPLGAGIKYAIVGDINLNSYRNPRISDYKIDYRTYYPGAETSYKYYVSDKNSGLDITATYPKTILTNKIVIKFEISHSIPESWAIYNGNTQIASGTDSDIKPFKTGNSKNYDAGTLVIYYNGSSWSTTQGSTISAPTSMNSLRLVTSGVTNKYIGLIEMSPRWVKDISEKVTDISVTQESSNSQDDILPIGMVSANSLAVSLLSFEDTREVISYDKSMTLDATKTYLYKRVELQPYFKIYHSAGTLTDSSGTYEKIKQGTFYLDTWTIGEFGEISLNALDGAKILQETIAPSITVKGYSTTAIIRNLLDNIGFTNYNFNTTANDTSIFSVRFWWTDDGKTVWQSIQELCRDSQMVAIFDENNILQFYTKEYIFNASDPIDWTFRYDKDGNNLSNIYSLNKQDLSSANQVKVLWNSVTTNEYAGNAQPLWKSNNTNMGALSLEQNLYENQNAGSYINLRLITNNDVLENQILNEYSGYLAIDSEIIEYDAIQYEYNDLNGFKQTVDISTGSDALKYLGLSLPGSGNFQPNGKYRIKNRGVFDTRKTNHYANAQGILDSWSGYEVTWV